MKIRKMKTLFYAVTVLVTLFTTEVFAVDVNVVGLFNGKALVEIDRGNPRMLSVGQTTPEGVKLISAESDNAVFEIEGKRTKLQMGQSVSANRRSSTGPATVTLIADGSGHFVTDGSINGSPTRFLVDTGATYVAMGTSEAKKLGINYLQGAPGRASTAGGIVSAYKVVLNSVRVGNITLNQVDGFVIEGPGAPITLLGMSFLSRVQMKREGSTMTLVKQY